MRERAAATPVTGWSEEAPQRGPDDGTVDVWLASLDHPPVCLDRLWELLAPDEAERAHRFRFDVHRERFVAGRGLLRLLLGRALDRPPAEIAFQYGAKGKPSLQPADPDVEAAAHGVDLRFNLSHSADLALFALARGRELGVDIEQLRPLDDAASIVERFFAPAERQTFGTLGHSHQLVGFYSGWTRKEAYVKARGDGLSLPTTAFEMEIVPDRRPRLVRFDEEPDEVDRWSFETFEPADGYLGAVAVEGDPERELEVVVRHWRE